VPGGKGSAALGGKTHRRELMAGASCSHTGKSTGGEMDKTETWSAGHRRHARAGPEGPPAPALKNDAKKNWSNGNEWSKTGRAVDLQNQDGRNQDAKNKSEQQIQDEKSRGKAHGGKNQ
jgi:hypothetical protein